MADDVPAPQGARRERARQEGELKVYPRIYYTKQGLYLIKKTRDQMVAGVSPRGSGSSEAARAGFDPAR